MIPIQDVRVDMTVWFLEQGVLRCGYVAEIVSDAPPALTVSTGGWMKDRVFYCEELHADPAAALAACEEYNQKRIASLGDGLAANDAIKSYLKHQLLVVDQKIRELEINQAECRRNIDAATEMVSKIQNEDNANGEP